MDINSLNTQLTQLNSMNDVSCIMRGRTIINELSTNIRSANAEDMKSIMTCCDKILQKSLCKRGNLFQVMSFFSATAPKFIVFLEELLKKDVPLAVCNILLYQGNDIGSEPAGYTLAHGEYRDRFFEKIINKLPEDLAKNLRNAAFVIYLDEARTEAVEYDLLGDGVRYLL